MNILVTGIGGPTPRSIALHLRRIYPDAVLIGADINEKAIGFHLKGLLNTYEQVPRASNNVAYFKAIHGVIAKYAIDLAFVQPEYEVLAWGHYFNDKDEYPCLTIIPPVEHVIQLMDKAMMADLFKKTNFIPKTVRLINGEAVDYDLVEREIGYPCWIRASVGSGGLGSLRLNSKSELEAWLFIHKDVPVFTVSEFLTGRHLANQMLYSDGKCVANAGLHCAEYVMADIAPSKVTGNTSYGLMLNEEDLLARCEEVMAYVQESTGVKANGVYSFDFKEDNKGRLLVTEINIRHMAYTGIMAQCGFDLIKASVELIQGSYEVPAISYYHFDKEYTFLRDVDIEPIILTKPF